MNKQARPSIDRAQSEALGTVLKSVCDQALEAHGLAIEDVQVRHGEHFGFSLRAVRTRTAGAQEGDAPSMVDTGAEPFPSELLGRQFQLGSRTYIFLGIDPASQLHPVAVEDAEDGSRGGLRDTPTLRMALRAASHAPAAAAMYDEA